MNAAAIAPQPIAPPRPSRRLSPSARGVVVPLVLFGMYACFGVAWMAVVPLFPELKAALGVDSADAAWLVTIVSLVKSFVPVAAGLFAARFGLTASMRLAAILIAFVVVSPWLPGFASQLAARFVFGAGGAMWLALMGAVVVDAVTVGRRGFVNAMNGVAVNVGAIVGLKTALPLNDALGHRGALTVLSAGTVVFALLVFLCGPLSTAEATAPTNTTAPRAPAGDVARAYLRVLGEKTTWLVAAAFCGPLALYLVMNTWLPTHLQAVWNMTRPEAAAWLSTMNLWGIPASLAIGAMLQRNIGSLQLHIAVGAVLLPAGVLGALTADAAMRPVFFALAGVGMFVPVAPLVTLLQQQPGMTAAKVGMVMGTMGSVTYVVSALAPQVVGHFVARGVATDALLVPCCLLGLSPGLALLLREPRGGG